MNLQWANAKMQGNNTSVTRKFTYQGQTKTLTEWARITGIQSSTLRYRLIVLKWDPHEAFTDKSKLVFKPSNTIFEKEFTNQ